MIKKLALAAAITAASLFGTVGEAEAHPSKYHHYHQNQSGKACYYRKTAAKPIYIYNAQSRPISYKLGTRWFTVYPKGTNRHYVGGGTTSCNQKPNFSYLRYDRRYSKGFQGATLKVRAYGRYVFARDSYGNLLYRAK